MMTKAKSFRVPFIFCLVLITLPLLGLYLAERFGHDVLPYQSNLTLQPGNLHYAPLAHDWVDQKTVFGPIDDTVAPIIPDLPTKNRTYSTNVALTLTYQYAQTGGGLWGENQRLFWRKESSESWREIVVSQEYVSIIGFAVKDGQIWLAAESGLIDTDLYFIDLETSAFTKQFATRAARLSPDQKKIAFITSSGRCDATHTISVWDLENDTKTTLTTLTESDPCSGGSFNYKWSTDSTLLWTSGRAYGLDHFDYVYDHEKKALFEM